jgi:two-component system, chemotaxis family, chemotaxis protein CheY
MSKTVLIVDDAAFMRTTLKNILTRQDFEVIGEGKNGLEGVEMFRLLKPDLVTMDIVMPEMNGIDAVKSIMEIDPNAVIIMCSAMGQQALVIEAIQAGAKDFVIKPFQAARVVEAIERAQST